MPSLEYNYPSLIESEEKMLDDVIEFLAVHEIDRDLQDRFLLAVSEAFTNALIHGNKYNPRKLIKVTLTVNEDFINADIADEGRGGVESIKGRRPSSSFSEGGRGVDLIEHCAHDVKFSETENGGLRVSLRFDRFKKKTDSIGVVATGGNHGNHR